MDRIRVLFWVMVLGTQLHRTASADPAADEPPPFAKGSQEFAVTAGAGPGVAIFGSEKSHDLALTAIRYSRTISETKAEDTYREGHWDLAAEIFGGVQFRPGNSYVTGIIPMLRYNFTDHEPFVPFFDIGAGVTLTDIGEPDLGGIFQFNEQIGVGAHYLLGERTAITVQYRFMHISNSGIERPNQGANANIFSAGITWFF